MNSWTCVVQKWILSNRVDTNKQNGTPGYGVLSTNTSLIETMWTSRPGLRVSQFPTCKGTIIFIQNISYLLSITGRHSPRYREHKYTCHILLCIMCTFMSKSFEIFYLFIFGERGRGEKERNILVWLHLLRPLLGTWPATQACVLTGN